MKEIYEKPVTDVEKFKTVDVITTSGTEFPKDDNDTPWPFG